MKNIFSTVLLTATSAAAEINDATTTSNPLLDENGQFVDASQAVSNINSLWEEWDIVNKTWKMDGDDYPRWVSFDETKDGSLGYMKNRVITIEYRYTVNSCTITFNANGGTGAPSSITWWYGHKITIPSGIPTRTGYTFTG